MAKRKSPEYHAVKKAVEDYAEQSYSDGYDDGLREIDMILKTSSTTDEIIHRIRLLLEDVLPEPPIRTAKGTP